MKVIKTFYPKNRTRVEKTHETTQSVVKKTEKKVEIWRPAAMCLFPSNYPPPAHRSRVSPFAYVPSLAPCVHLYASAFVCVRLLRVCAFVYCSHVCVCVCGCFISLSACSITHDDQGTPYYIIILLYIIFVAAAPSLHLTPRSSPPPTVIDGVSACVRVPSAVAPPPMCNTDARARAHTHTYARTHSFYPPPPTAIRCTRYNAYYHM